MFLSHLFAVFASSWVALCLVSRDGCVDPSATTALERGGGEYNTLPSLQPQHSPAMSKRSHVLNASVLCQTLRAPPPKIRYTTSRRMSYRRLRPNNLPEKVTTSDVCICKEILTKPNPTPDKTQPQTKCHSGQEVQDNSSLKTLICMQVQILVQFVSGSFVLPKANSQGVEFMRCRSVRVFLQPPRNSRAFRDGKSEFFVFFCLLWPQVAEGLFEAALTGCIRARSWKEGGKGNF